MLYTRRLYQSVFSNSIPALGISYMKYVNGRRTELVTF
jgi:hypothetical protein